MTREEQKARAEIERLERELEKATNLDRRAEIIDELNWYEEQFCERY